LIISGKHDAQYFFGAIRKNYRTAGDLAVKITGTPKQALETGSAASYGVLNPAYAG